MWKEPRLRLDFRCAAGIGAEDALTLVLELPAFVAAADPAALFCGELVDGILRVGFALELVECLAIGLRERDVASRQRIVRTDHLFDIKRCLGTVEARQRRRFLDGRHFRALDEDGNPATPERSCKPASAHVLMSRHADGRAVSFFGDLHVMGKEGVQFYTRQKLVLSRWDNTYKRTMGW